MRGIVGVAGALALASGALGQSWAEVGDAGDLPGTAQVVTGSGPLTSITGTNDASDVDMYQICISDEVNFSASTVGGTTFDTQLWLFDSAGRGLALNDDHVGGTTLQSTLTSMFVNSNGVYYVAVSRYNRDPVNAANALIWANSPFRAERAPDGPGAGDPVPTGWVNSTTAGGAYAISLTGAKFIPTPASAAVLGLVGIAALRRRR